MCSENNEDGKGPVSILALAMATPAFVHAAYQNIDQRFLPANQRGGEMEKREKRRERMKHPRWFTFDALGFFGGKRRGFTDFIDFFCNAGIY